MKQIVFFSFFLFSAKASFSAGTNHYMAGDLNCAIYRNGYFRYPGEYENFVILREGNFQIEYNLKTKEWVTVKLTWSDGCDYSFVYISTNMKSVKSSIGMRVDVDIVSGNATGYFYRAVIKGIEEEFEGHIIFLQEKMTPSQDKRVRKKLAKTSIEL